MFVCVYCVCVCVCMCEQVIAEYLHCCVYVRIYMCCQYACDSIHSTCTIYVPHLHYRKPCRVKYKFTASGEKVRVSR